MGNLSQYLLTFLLIPFAFFAPSRLVKKNLYSSFQSVEIQDTALPFPYYIQPKKIKLFSGGHIARRTRLLVSMVAD
jgi:hypothetical protein